MFNLPKSTVINKNIYKKYIYKRFSSEFSGKKRDEFNKDIGKITIINEISEQSVNIKRSENISAIFVVEIELKTEDFNEWIISLISNLFEQNLLLVLKYKNKYKLAIYEKKIFFSNWKTEEEINFELIGLDLSSVWDNLVLQITDIEIDKENNLSEQIDIEILKEELKTKIEKLEKKINRENQAKKKFELYQQMKTYEKELEEI